MAGAQGTTVARINVKVSPDTRKFRRDLKSQLTDIERTVQATIDVDADTSSAKANFAAALATMKAEAAKGVDIKVGIDKRGLGGVTPGSLLPDLGGFASGGGAAGGGLLGALGGGGDITMILKVAAALAALGPSVNVLSTALTAIPGLLTGIATPIAAITLGFDGIKAAFAPLMPMFEGIKATVSAIFSEGLLAPFDRLKSLIPTLTIGLGSVANSVVSVIDGITKGLTSEVGSGAIADIFQNVANTVREMGPGIQQFTVAFLQLAAAVTGSGLSAVFNDFAETFGMWVADITTLGPNGLSPLQESLSGLLEVVKSVGPGLGELISSGLEGMKDPNFIENVKSTITGLMDFINAISTVGSAIASFAPLFQAIAFPFLMVAQNVRDLVSAFKAIPTALEAAKNLVGAAVSVISSTVSAAFNAIPGIVSAAWEAVSAAVSAGVDAAVSFVASLPGKITGAIGDLSGLLVGAGKAIMDGLLSGLKAAWGAVQDFVGGIASWIAENKGPIAYDAKLLTPHGEAMMNGLSNGLTSGFEDVKTQVSGMAGELSDEFTNGIDTSSKVDWNQKMGDMGGIGFDFVTANARQFANDLGISGGGAAGAFVDYGLGVAREAVTNNVFNVNGVDEAMALQQRQVNRQTMGANGR